MEHELRFGLDLGWLAILKKKTIWVNYKELLSLFFSSFREEKNEIKTL